MNQIEFPACPICNEINFSKERELESGKIRINCERCGKYDIAREYAVLGSKPWSEVSHLVSAWIRRENKAKIGIPDPTLGARIHDVDSPEWWSNQFTHMGFPETTNEKLDALLLAYAISIDSNPGKQFSFGYPHFIADVAAKNQVEIDGLNDLLDELGYIEKKYPKIKAKGWLRIDELRRSTVISNSTFVAMWFDDSTKKYRDAVIAAIEYCGYEPIIVDQQEYNGFIMDQIVSLIKKSRFLVADFTARPEVEEGGKVKKGVRGGVYWEAGMAYGLGGQVIHTCEDSMESKSRVHFDVNQYNTIFWKEEELSTVIRSLDQPISNPNFAEKLANRILATVGRGSSSKK